MPDLESIASRARRASLVWGAALAGFGGLALAAVWSAADLNRAAEEARLSGAALGELARLRRMLASERVLRTGAAGPAPAGVARRAEEALQRLTTNETDPDEVRAYGEIGELVRRRLSTAGGSTGDRAALDARIHTLVHSRELTHRARLYVAAARLRTRGSQTLILVGVQGVLAAGVVAFAAARSRPPAP